jgi:rare lipoprotein A
MDNTAKKSSLPALAALAATLALGSTGSMPSIAQSSEQATQSSAAEHTAQDARRHEAPVRLSPEANPSLDRSGRRRVGKASFYANMFFGRTMADGTPMRPTGNNAASRTLPLGTTARVTNLETGKTAVVTIRDRGPYVAGRIVDLSPATARKIGLDRRTGVTRVAVAPITVPLANGEIKLGDGVLEASNREPPGRQLAQMGD